MADADEGLETAVEQSGELFVAALAIIKVVALITAVFVLYNILAVCLISLVSKL